MGWENRVDAFFTNPWFKSRESFDWCQIWLELDKNQYNVFLKVRKWIKLENSSTLKVKNKKKDSNGSKEELLEWQSGVDSNSGNCCSNAMWSKGWSEHTIVYKQGGGADFKKVCWWGRFGTDGDGEGEFLGWFGQWMLWGIEKVMREEIEWLCIGYGAGWWRLCAINSTNVDFSAKRKKSKTCLEQSYLSFFFFIFFTFYSNFGFLRPIYTFSHIFTACCPLSEKKKKSSFSPCSKRESSSHEVSLPLSNWARARRRGWYGSSHVIPFYRLVVSINNNHGILSFRSLLPSKQQPPERHNVISPPTRTRGGDLDPIRTWNRLRSAWCPRSVRLSQNNRTNSKTKRIGIPTSTRFNLTLSRTDPVWPSTLYLFQHHRGWFLSSVLVWEQAAVASLNHGKPSHWPVLVAISSVSSHHSSWQTRTPLSDSWRQFERWEWWIWTSESRWRIRRQNGHFLQNLGCRPTYQPRWRR